ncbi:MAG: flagellar hook-length control protein FliK [Alphaproteobacteria bacterium]
MTSDILIPPSPETAHQSVRALGNNLSQTSGDSTPANDETFANIVETATKAQQNAEANPPKSQENSEVSTTSPSPLSQTTENALFFTYRTDAQAPEDTTQIATDLTGQHSGNTKTPIDHLAALMNTVTPGYEQRNLDNAQRTDQIVTTEEQSETPDLNSLLSLLPSINTESSADKSNLDIVQRALSSQNNFNILLSDLSPDEKAEIQELIAKFLDGTLNTEELETLEILASQIIGITAPSSTSQQGSKTEVRAQNSDQFPLRNDLQQQQTTPAAPFARSGQEQQPLTNGNAAPPITDQPKTEQSQSTLPPLTTAETNETFKDALARRETSSNAGQQHPQQTQVQNQTPPPAVAPPTQETVSLLSTDEAVFSMTEYGFSNKAPLQSTLSQNVTQAPSATALHPATNMVSATIQKAVKAGEDTNIRLMLDPPELGRVEVKMSIDQDNNSKIVLTAEKPETYMMLRRDADMLERALSENGLDTQSELSFEMAKDNQMFERQNQDDETSSGTNGFHDDEPEIIETKMDWNVDPQTGHIHYNIMA